MPEQESLHANFHFPVPYRIGSGRITELGSACGELGMRRPLLVTDPGIVSLPWFARVRESLERADVSVSVFSEVQGNPTGSNVEAGVRAYRDGNHDGCVLLGGGSALDAGKAIALMARNPGSVFDYEDVGDNWKAADPEAIPSVLAIPTTAGTGSEVGRAAIILDERDHGKKVIFHPKMQPSLVLADPELTFELPAKLTAATGMDALAHCFEAYCARGYHPMADGIALEGMRLIAANLQRCVDSGHDAEARTHMMMAATMGATAFQKGLGLVHALSHPLGGATGIHHGLANAVFLPYVMAFNRPMIETRMQRLARHLELPEPGFDGVLQWLLDLRQALHIPHTLEQATPEFDEAMAKRLVPLAARDPTLAGNPRECTDDDLETVFGDALRGRLRPGKAPSISR